MKKYFLMILAFVASGCSIINHYRFSAHECSFEQDVCENNIKELRQGIENFKASGGAYFIKDMNTFEIMETGAFGYDINSPLQANFSKIGINETLTPVQLLSKYTDLVKDNNELKQLLRDNVQNGTAKNVNISGLDVYGITSTTEKNSNKEVITTFLGHFNDRDKKYALVVILDNPKPLKLTYGFRTAGWNAVKIAKNIINYVCNN